MLDEKEFENIVYVAVEVAHAKTRQILVGYFKGIIPFTNYSIYLKGMANKYLILKATNAIFVLNPEYFHITTISIGLRRTNSWGVNSTIKRTFNLKQDASLALLDKIYEFFIDNRETIKNNLIDTSKFEVHKNDYLYIALKKYNTLDFSLDGPAKSGEKKTTTGAATNTNTGKKIIVKNGEINNAWTTTTVFERTTKYDKDKAIKALNEKIEKLRANKYTVVLPIDKDDEKSKEDDKKQSTDLTAYDEENFNPAYFCC